MQKKKCRKGIENIKIIYKIIAVCMQKNMQKMQKYKNYGGKFNT